MTIKFLYIDDEENDTVEGIKVNLKLDGLEIFHERALSWDEQIKRIKHLINDIGYDGLLLDLKLEFPIENQKLNYYASSLAQEVRSLVKRSEIKDVPIFICSTNDNLKKLHDATADDLFDEAFDKTLLNSSYAKYFVSHVFAYSKIKDDSNIFKLLSPNKSKNELLVDLNQFYLNKETVHEKAKFLLREVIEPTGILIKESLLAIRLGIDVQKSPIGWENLKDHFKEWEYDGIYKDLNKRWWLSDIYQWWYENINSNQPFSLLTSNERIEMISKKLGIDNLKAIKKPQHHNNENYLYECISSRIPIAEGDGLSCLPKPYPWQERDYISVGYYKELGAKDKKEINNILSLYELEKLK